MSNEVTTISFDAWVAYLFGQRVSDPSWRGDDNDRETAELPPTVLLEYTTQLFNNSANLLRPFSDAQLDQGLWFLVGESTSDLYALTDDSILLENRVACAKSIYHVFEQCFAKRCSDHLSHLDQAGASPLNSICYMWWDIFPVCSNPEKPSLKAVDDACIESMDKTLKLPSIACQESAIHGLAHWKSGYENRCKNILTDFMDRNPNLLPELHNYALAARDSYVQ